MKVKRLQTAGVAKRELLGWSLPRVLGATYGLLSKKAASPRWPEFIITALVLKKYRGKSSFWFMVIHAARGMRESKTRTVQKPNAEALRAEKEVREIVARLIGSAPHDLHRLSGIYKGLLRESGVPTAAAAIAEIISITNAKRTKKAKRRQKIKEVFKA